MAKETSTVTEEPKVELTAQEKIEQSLLSIKHEGFGVYSAGNMEFKGDNAKADATKYVEDINKVIRSQLSKAILQERIPEGYENYQDNTLVFRESLYELPMNEQYQPDGSINPMYDNEWLYGWAADRTESVGSWKGKGYRLLSRKELEGLVNNGKMPEMYLSIIEDHEGALRFGTEILMRIPRFLHRQNIAEPRKRDALAMIKAVDRQQQQTIANSGAEVIVPSGENDVQIRL